VRYAHAARIAWCALDAHRALPCALRDAGQEKVTLPAWES
jgi:hypothetical protein